MRRSLLLVLPALLAAVAAGCGSSGSGNEKTLTVVVNSSFSKNPYIADTIYNGAKLAVLELAQQGTVKAGDTNYRLKVVRYDTAGSPVTAVANVRKAVSNHALAILDDGTGVDASWEIANKAHIPIGIVYQGGVGLVDPATRPNVFRISPTDHGVAFRLAEYLIPKGLKIALLHDDSGYGQQGAKVLDQAFGSNPKSVAAKITLPSAASDLAPQMLAARRAGADAVLVWAQGPVIAKALIAARSAGWNVPFYTPGAGADPVVRQSLADHPSWVDGLTFASGRLTAEEGPGPFYTFSSKYQTAFGADKVGVKTSDGSSVIQPPEYAMYAYDFTRLLIAALQRAGSDDPAKILNEMNEVTIEGANGDERGFNEKSHDGVVDDDVYFARFHDMTYQPVQDDPLSSTLPAILQTQQL
jgi:ABC-type branched-subunit amino acid transport system substrate-binding protein